MIGTMIYLYLSERTIKVLSVSKSVIGQQSLSHFHKVYETDILNDVASSDIIGTAIKEALTNTSPAPITDNEVCLILPQTKFQFMRFSIPPDIAPRAVTSFLKDKIKNENHVHIDDSYYDCLVSGTEGQSVALTYILPKSALKPIEEAFRLINLKLVNIIPDTVCYYTLFSKTLREDKIENILYVTYESTDSSLYEYDSLGLVNPEKIELSGDPAIELSNIVKKYEAADKKVHRIILSGSMSKQVRQDHFTKEVGAWTNPLERIILNFYHSYLKSLSIESMEGFSLLHYDMCFGAHIFNAENKTFALLKNHAQTTAHLSTIGSTASSQRIFSPKEGGGKIISFRLNLKFISILIASLLITMGVVLTLSKGTNLASLLPSQATPTPEPTKIPTATPSPTPVINRDKLKIKVLNGGGVKGKATVVKDFLKEKGYGDIVTGNASSFDIENSKIEYRSEGSNLGNLFKSDLAELIEVTTSTEMESSTSADIIFTIGKDLK